MSHVWQVKADRLLSMPPDLAEAPACREPSHTPTVPPPPPPNTPVPLPLCAHPQIRDKYQLRLPAYPGVSQCVRIGGSGRSPAAGPANVADLRVSYGAAGQALDETDVSAAGAHGQRLCKLAWWAGWEG